MKRIVWSLLFLLAAGLITLRSLALAQDAEQIPQAPLHGYYTYGKLRGVTTEQAMRGAAAATSIPLFSYSVTSNRDSNHYSGVMVGRSPFFHGARTVNIPVVIIPVKFTMTDRGNRRHWCLIRLPPTRPARRTAQPLTCSRTPRYLQPGQFHDACSGGINVGTGQYIDEFQRANFWSSVSVTGDRYHTVLSLQSPVCPVQAVTVPTWQGKGYKPKHFGGGSLRGA